MGIQVSIIVPVYKVQEELLRKCVSSCTNQNNKEIEIILVDDCSPDACGQICDDLAQNDDRITVVHKSQNEGLAAARNTGFKLAKGEWISFVDGDDWIEPDMCDLIANPLITDECELIFFGIYRDYNNSVNEMPFGYADEKVYSKDECKQLQVDILDYYKRLSTAYAKLIRRDFLVKHGLMHNEILRMGLEGIDFNTRVFGELSCCVSYDKYLYHYVYNDDSYTARPDKNRIKMLFLGLQSIDEYITEKANNSVMLRSQLTKRTLRATADTALAIIFNPDFKYSYVEKKKMLSEFKNKKTISEAIVSNEIKETKGVQRIALECIKRDFFFTLLILGRARKIYMRMK